MDRQNLGSHHEIVPSGQEPLVHLAIRAHLIWVQGVVLFFRLFLIFENVLLDFDIFETLFAFTLAFSFFFTISWSSILTLFAISSSIFRGYSLLLLVLVFPFDKCLILQN